MKATQAKRTQFNFRTTPQFLNHVRHVAASHGTDVTALITSAVYAAHPPQGNCLNNQKTTNPNPPNTQI